jgi:5-keto 4-deoxyuronate isomerase
MNFAINLDNLFIIAPTYILQYPLTRMDHIYLRRSMPLQGATFVMDSNYKLSSNNMLYISTTAKTILILNAAEDATGSLFYQIKPVAS